MRDDLIQRVHGPGLCGCGCGLKTKIAAYNCTSRGWIKGNPLAFVRGHQNRRHWMTDRERMEENTYPDPNSGCFIWAGKTGMDGYGEIRVLGKLLRTHRVAWELNIGPIPDGLFVCHKCDVRCCVNPDHLFLGTVQDNAIDMALKGRARKSPKGLPRGVVKNGSKWEAQIVVLGTGLPTRIPGRFDTVEEAAEAYRREHAKLYGPDFIAAARAELYGAKEA